jgi:hypothetical protein
MCHEAFSRDEPSGHGIISQRIRDRVYSLQDGQCTHNVTLWRAGVTIMRRKHTTVLSVHVIVELQCYSQLYKMLSGAQQCVYGTFFFAGNNADFTCQFLTQIIFQLICTVFTLRVEAALKENSARLNVIFVCSWPLLDVHFACTDRNDVSRCVVSQIL